MQADPWWSFAMAFNVFLVFFNNANPSKFQEYKWIYCVVCFGGPLLPAIVLVSIRDEERGPVFGDAAVSIPDITCMLEGYSDRSSSCGAGSGPNGALFVFMRTTFPFGSVSSSLFSCTLL